MAMPRDPQIRAFKGTHKFARSREPTILRIQGNPSMCTLMGGHRFAHSGEPTELPPQGNQWNPPLRAFTGEDHVAHSRVPRHSRIQGNPQTRALKGTHWAFDRALWSSPGNWPAQKCWFRSRRLHILGFRSHLDRSRSRSKNAGCRSRRLHIL